MRILIAGGTSFVGRAIAMSAHAAGHDVTVVNRGRTPSDLPEDVERLVGDRHGDLSALAGRTFDATVDTIAYRPSDVDALARALDGRGGTHLQISSVSAYREPDRRGLGEEELELADYGDVDLTGPIDGYTYGPLKAASEDRARDLYDDLVVLRPTYVVGSHDATLRFPYWVMRARRGGRIVVPGPRDADLQWVDARDLADFAVRCLTDSIRGAFSVAGPEEPIGFAAAIERVVAHCAPAGATVEVVEASRVEEAGLAERFPLWAGPEPENLMTVSSRAALARGLSLRALEESVDDVLTWWADREWAPHWLTSDDEARLSTTN